MGQIKEAAVWCKNKDCSMFEKQQTIRFANLDDFYGTPGMKFCPICKSTGVSYSSAGHVGIGMTVQETIEVLSLFNPNAILSLEIEVGTCEYGTCFESYTNYPYEFWEVDNKSEVKILYSPNKD